MFDRFEHTGIAYSHKPTAYEEEEAAWYKDFEREQEIDDRFLLAQDAGFDEHDADEFANGDWCDIDDYIVYKNYESDERNAECEPDFAYAGV